MELESSPPLMLPLNGIEDTPPVRSLTGQDELTDDIDIELDSVLLQDTDQTFEE